MAARRSDRKQALQRFAEASYTLSAADARLRGRATRVPGALSFPHARALRVLTEQGPMSIGGLAQHTETSGAAVTQLVNGLVAAGYVTRERPEDNRRSVLVTITEAGRDRHTERQRILDDAFAEALGHLDADQLDATTEVLRALVTIYDRL